MGPSCRLIKKIKYKGYTINVICTKIAVTKLGLIYHERCTCTIEGVYKYIIEPPKARAVAVPSMFKSVYSAKKYINNLTKEKNNEKIN